MRNAFWTVSLALLFTTGAVQAQDNPQQVLEKAIAAHGGEANLAKFTARTWKAKGKVHIQGMEINFTGDWAAGGLNKARTAISADFNGQQFQFTMVLNGEQGWRKMGEDTNEMSEQELKNERNNAHLSWISRLLPLKDKAYTLTMLKETTVENQPAVGINVARQGYNDIKLYFDKQTHLLVKADYQTFDMQSGGDVNAESIYSNFKDIQGVKVGMKQVVKREGAVFVESELSDFQLHEKLDENLFKKPE